MSRTAFFLVVVVMATFAVSLADPLPAKGGGETKLQNCPVSRNVSTESCLNGNNLQRIPLRLKVAQPRSVAGLVIYAQTPKNANVSRMGILAAVGNKCAKFPQILIIDKQSPSRNSLSKYGHSKFNLIK